MTADNRYSRSLSATMLRSALGRLPRARPSLAPADHIGRAADRRREIAIEPETSPRSSVPPGPDGTLPSNGVWMSAPSSTRSPRSRRRTDGHAGVRQIARRAQEGRDAVRTPQDPSSLRAHAAERSLGRPRRVPPRRNRAEPQNALRSASGDRRQMWQLRRRRPDAARRAYAEVNPPSITIVCPVTEAAAGLASQQTAAATSSGVASRCSGMRCSIAAM